MIAAGASNLMAEARSNYWGPRALATVRIAVDSVEQGETVVAAAIDFAAAAAANTLDNRQEVGTNTRTQRSTVAIDANIQQPLLCPTNCHWRFSHDTCCCYDGEAVVVVAAADAAAAAVASSIVLAHHLHRLLASWKL